MAVLNGLKYVLQRNKQYFQHHKINYFLFLLLLVVNAGLAFLLFKQWKPVVKPAYIVTDPLGNVLWSCPLNDKYTTTTQKNYCSNQLTDDKVKAFAKKAMQSAMSLDFVNYASEMNAASSYFSKKGWAAYAKGFVDSGNLKNLLGKAVDFQTKIIKAQVNTLSIGSHDRGVSKKNGRYTWVVRMNVFVPGFDKSRWYFVTVQREPVENYPDRLAVISSYSVS